MDRKPGRARFAERMAIAFAVVFFSTSACNEDDSKTEPSAVGELAETKQALLSDSDGYLLIHDCGELQSMETDFSANYRLANDVDCTGFDAGDGLGFRPVGLGDAAWDPFTGHFDGAGHIVANLSIARPSLNAVGMFGVAYGATIENVGLVNVAITGAQGTGAILGASNNGTVIRQVYATGSVNGAWTGGLVGWMQDGSTLEDCYTVTPPRGAS